MTDKEPRKAKDYLVRAGERGDETPVRHPLNPDSKLYWTPLSDRVGMQRAQLHLARTPPGKESLISHAHEVQEEFVFILEGTGEAEIAGEALEIGPGDYLGFPTDGAAHTIRNTGQADLVYLMGGERTELEVAHFPTRGKVMIAHLNHVYLADVDALEKKTKAEWIADSQIDEAAGPDED